MIKDRLFGLYKHGLVLSVLTAALLPVLVVAGSLMGGGVFLLTSLIDFPPLGSIPYQLQGVFYLCVSLLLLLGICFLYGLINGKLLEYIWSIHAPFSMSKTVGTGLFMCFLYAIYHSITLSFYLVPPVGSFLFLVLTFLVYPPVDGFVAMKLTQLEWGFSALFSRNHPGLMGPSLPE